MAQSEILDFLEKNKGEKFTAKEMAKQFGLCDNSARKNLMRLWEARFIERINVYNGFGIHYKYFVE